MNAPGHVMVPGFELEALCFHYLVPGSLGVPPGGHQKAEPKPLALKCVLQSIELSPIPKNLF